MGLGFGSGTGWTSICTERHVSSKEPCGGVLSAPGPPSSHLCLELDLRWTGPERGLPQRQLRSQETAQPS